MDGINYSECEEPFKIYSNDIFLTSINPKCASITGGTNATLLINIDEVTAQNLQYLKIGFQPKKSKRITPEDRATSAKKNQAKKKVAATDSQTD